MLYQLLVDRIEEDCAASEPVHYHKGWLANVIGFVGVQLENLLITQYEGPHTDDIAVTEAEAYIFALDLLDRNTSQL